MILDQRAVWVFLLAYLVVKGAGIVSVDAAIGRMLIEPAAAPRDRETLDRGKLDRGTLDHGTLGGAPLPPDTASPAGR